MNSKRVVLVLLGVLLARPLAAQSLIFPSVLDHHWVHAATKPAVSLGVYGIARAVHVSKPIATIGALAVPLLVSQVRWEIIAPGHWKWAVTLRDDLADTWASALSMILLRLRGWQRVIATALWAAVEIWPVGLHRWARP